jgi:hypothetical protein
MQKSTLPNHFAEEKTASEKNCNIGSFSDQLPETHFFRLIWTNFLILASFQISS